MYHASYKPTHTQCNYEHNVVIGLQNTETIINMKYTNYRYEIARLPLHVLT